MSRQFRYEGNDFLRSIAPSITGKVANIGSGSDRDKQGNYYKSYFVNAASYTTIDYSAERGCEIVSDIRNLENIESEAFDAVVNFWVLEHIDDVDAAIQSIHRVLKPGGVFIWGVPLAVKYHGWPFDFHRFTLSCIVKLLKKHFNTQKIQAVGEHGPFNIDEKLNFYSEPDTEGPVGYVGISTKK